MIQVSGDRNSKVMSYIFIVLRFYCSTKMFLPILKDRKKPVSTKNSFWALACVSRRMVHGHNETARHIDMWRETFVKTNCVALLSWLHDVEEGLITHWRSIRYVSTLRVSYWFLVLMCRQRYAFFLIPPNESRIILRPCATALQLLQLVFKVLNVQNKILYLYIYKYRDIFACR